MSAAAELVDVIGASGCYSRYERSVARAPRYCLICKRRDAVQPGDARLVRQSDHVTDICVKCEPEVLARPSTRVVR